MQPGGKRRPSESDIAALDRELQEEVRCSIVVGSPEFLGTFTAPAANENGVLVEAALYRVKRQGKSMQLRRLKSLSGSIHQLTARLNSRRSRKRKSYRSQFDIQRRRGDCTFR